MASHCGISPYDHTRQVKSKELQWPVPWVYWLVLCCSQDSLNLKRYASQESFVSTAIVTCFIMISESTPTLSQKIGLTSSQVEIIGYAGGVVLGKPKLESIVLNSF
jgi:hypothetical protein